MRISCRKCGNNEPGTFTYFVLLVAGAEQANDGSWSDLQIQNATRTAWLSCNGCGHSWSTRRKIDAGW